VVAERTRFHNVGLTWAERAAFGGLQAVVSLGGGRPAEFLHGVHRHAAARALRYFRSPGWLIDFGCGNGRFVHYFTSKGHHVLGTEITFEMILSAKRLILSTKRKSGDVNCHFVVTDGIAIPVANNSICGIWCCAVLRYSLLVDNPCYREIGAEMFRVLRPGAHVVNCETYVDVDPERFTDPFEEVGFKTRQVLVLNRYRLFERFWWKQILLTRWVSDVGVLCAALRANFDSAWRPSRGLRDYLFVWQKPE
jgi:SAM-dependent methyltransferase